MLSRESLDRLASKFVSEEIALDQEDISSAVKSKEWLLDRIKTKIKEKTNGPQLYAEDPLIGYGSYFAKLKVADVDEMDFLLVIDSNTGIFRNDGTTEYGKGLGSASPNHKYNSEFMKSDSSGVSPNKLLGWLRGICWEVLEPLNGEMPVIDGPAIKVVIKSTGLKFDLVPAGVFERTNGSGNIFYNIPRGDAAEGWLLTNPRKDIERIERLAEQHEGFRNVVRLLKFVRDHYGLPLSSYALQCVVCLYAENFQWQGDLLANLHHALILLENKLRNGVVEDGFDPAINLLKDLVNPGQYANVVQSIYLRLSVLGNESDEDVAYDKLWQILKNTSEAPSRNARQGLTSDMSALAQLLYSSKQRV